MSDHWSNQNLQSKFVKYYKFINVVVIYHLTVMLKCCVNYR